MSNKLSEQVSALMDDECTEQELKLAVRQLARDTALASQWERYHLISDVLKGQTPPELNTDFSRQMNQRLQQEQPLVPTELPSQPHQRRRDRSWHRPALGWALAASLAAVAVVLVWPSSTDQLPTDRLIAQQPASTPSSTQEDDIAARLTVYMANHNSLASMSSVYGVLPYVRMTSLSDGR